MFTVSTIVHGEESIDLFNYITGGLIWNSTM
jgi:hypothetical protein